MSPPCKRWSSCQAAELQFALSKCINHWRNYDQCSIELLHEPWYNEAELCRELHCTKKEEKKSLIKRKSVIFTPCEFFSSCLCNSMSLKRYKPSEWCQCAKEGLQFMHSHSGWTLLQCPDKLKKEMKIGPLRHSFSSKNQMKHLREDRKRKTWSFGTNWLILLYSW